MLAGEARRIASDRRDFWEATRHPDPPEPRADPNER
jgi:hypothetical protein